MEATGDDGHLLIKRQGDDAIVGLGRPDVFACFVPVREPPVPAACKHTVVLVEVDHGHGLLQLADHPRRTLQVHDSMRSPLHHKEVASVFHQGRSSITKGRVTTKCYLAGLRSMNDAQALIETLQAANARYAASFDAEGVPGKAGQRLLLLTCMDSRIVPHAVFGLKEGDMKVVRNAGGQLNPEVVKDIVLASK